MIKRIIKLEYFNKKYLFINILLFYFKLIANECSIIIPVEILSQDNYLIKNNQSHSNFIKKCFCNELFAVFEMGTPIQKVPLFLREREIKYEISSSIYIDNIPPKPFFFKYNLSNIIKSFDFFNENMSNTFKTEGCKKTNWIIEDHEQDCYSTDTFYFLEDINTKYRTEFKNLFFNLVKNKEDNITGEIGLGIMDKNVNSKNNFLKILKNKKIINNYNWYFEFDSWNDTKGKLALGSLPHEIHPNKYSEKDLVYTSIVIDYYNKKEYQIEFDKININSISLSTKIVEISFEKNVIMGTKELQNLVNEFIINKNCSQEKFNLPPFFSLTVTYYYCDKNLQEIFYQFLPSIKFYSKDLNYTFEITKEELFEIEEDYIFLKIFFPHEGKRWSFGRPISLKYTFVFNPDSGEIGFYRKYKDISEERKDNFVLKNFLKVGILIILSFGLIIFGIIIGKKLYGINRKARANELIDNYEYYSNDINKDINKENLFDKDKRSINSHGSIEMKINFDK